MLELPLIGPKVMIAPPIQTDDDDHGCDDDDPDDDRDASDGDYGENADNDSCARMAVGKSGCEGVEWKPLWSGRLLFLPQEKETWVPFFLKISFPCIDCQ